ncbi:hypothetical protein [Candidatus Formimonas warabiya]|uniref:Uncharacterized protein n=1 Tax=Formimonas warabiya TaxID=1761012 RepID=A0A3G1KNY9_FORW1|nr:hypothetical protein [Candidatus Formimonas warabiya]ATW24140.1 hypothetical protein DCMF_04505 [Candidatus Formimonas warabiya]
MFDKAVAKIKSEMDQNKNNSYIQVVGGFLLQHLNENLGAAEKIMQEGKTIAKSLDSMRNEASKKKVGNCAMFTPTEGFNIVLKYFNIAGTPSPDPAPAATTTPAPEPVKEEIGFSLCLEDLL